MEISTYQTGGRALPVDCVLIAEATEIDSELYLSALVDRANRCVTFMGSASGGVDIEQVAATEPEKIVTVQVDNTVGLQPYQCRQMGFGMGLNGTQVRQLGKIMGGLYRLFREKDLSLIEVNPLIIDKQDDLLALDAKINADGKAVMVPSPRMLVTWIGVLLGAGIFFGVGLAISATVSLVSFGRLILRVLVSTSPYCATQFCSPMVVVGAAVGLFAPTRDCPG